MTRLLVIQHLEREGPCLFLGLAKERGLEVNVIRVDLGESLPLPEKGDGLLILGGPMGVADLANPAFPWLKDEVQIIKYALEHQNPLIGVCLGAQLLSHAAGGAVEVLLGGTPACPLPEVGWAPIETAVDADDEPLLTNLTQPLDVLHWHGDRIILPNNAKILASSARCREQLFRVGRCAYGLQFHVEVEENEVIQWIAEDNEFICSALGDEAPTILMEQQKRYGANSKPRRLQLLEDLFKSLWP